MEKRLQETKELPADDTEYGVCDECGEYTEELVLIGGTWICKKCSRMF